MSYFDDILCPGVTYKKVIENHTDYDIVIHVYLDSTNHFSTFYKKDSFLIPKHSESTIIDYTQMAQTKKIEDCDTYCDSIVTRIGENDSLKLNLKMADKANWSFSLLDKTFKGGGTCECRLSITNDMIK